MSSFDKRITIDAMHNEVLKKFKNDIDNLPEKYNNLNNLINEYNSLKYNQNKNIEIYDLKFNLKKKINKLNNEIENIINKSDINEYYLNVGELLHLYYENKNIVAKNYSNNDIFINKNNDIEKKNILNFFKNNNDNNNINGLNNFNENEDNYNNDNDDINALNNFNENEDNYNNDNDTEYNDNNSDDNDDNDNDDNDDNDNIDDNYYNKKYKDDQYFTTTKISDFVETSLNFKKSDILDRYLNYVDPNYISKLKIDHNVDICQNNECKSNDLVIIPSEGIKICKNCGFEMSILIESDKPSFKDPPPEISYFAYKRINHFNEWLAQFQAKESTEIPQEVYDLILLEIKKERIKNLAKLNNSKIRNYLKRLKLNKYYEHIPHILNRLNGLPPPIMTKSTEEKLRIMFKEIQSPFMQVCPKNRKNFLSYSYVLHKFVELLGLDHYKSSFPLLKSREKLHQQDMIWKDICKILNWDFIKSI